MYQTKNCHERWPGRVIIFSKIGTLLIVMGQVEFEQKFGFTKTDYGIFLSLQSMQLHISILANRFMVAHIAQMTNFFQKSITLLNCRILFTSQPWKIHIDVAISGHKTHTHPFNSRLSGTTPVSRYQKGKISLDFTEARDSEWQWHQLGHMHATA